MTLPIARDLAVVGIRVNTILPGMIDTPIYGNGEASEQLKETLSAATLFPVGSVSRLSSRRWLTSCSPTGT